MIIVPPFTYNELKNSVSYEDIYMSFSERYGYIRARTAVQIEEMDSVTTNRLWSVADNVMNSMANSDDRYRYTSTDNILFKIWDQIFKMPTDTRGQYWSQSWQKVRAWFFDQSTWHERFDFLELMVADLPPPYDSQLKDTCNVVLEQQVSGYRFLQWKICPITDPAEIETIDQAASEANPCEGARTHIRKGLALFSDRESPDYPNTIKEAISAVEALVRLITQNDKATLGDALNEISSTVDLHGALKKGFQAIYGYTSDQGGIRHAFTEVTEIAQEDALFMLVSCSAFVNYLIVKANKAGLNSS